MRTLAISFLQDAIAWFKLRLVFIQIILELKNEMNCIIVDDMEKRAGLL
jgi:hypothetical protein